MKLVELRSCSIYFCLIFSCWVKFLLNYLHVQNCCCLIGICSIKYLFNYFCSILALFKRYLFTGHGSDGKEETGYSCANHTNLSSNTNYLSANPSRCTVFMKIEHRTKTAPFSSSQSHLCVRNRTMANLFELTEKRKQESSAPINRASYENVA